VHTIVNWETLLQWVAGTGSILVAGIITLGVYKKTSFEVLRNTNEALEKSNDQYKEDLTQVLRKVSALESTVRLQEGRLLLSEVEQERSSRLLKIARREIGMLEEIVEHAFSSLSRLNSEEGLTEIVRLKASLIQYRREAEDEFDKWQTLQDATISYLRQHSTETGAQTNDEMISEIRSRKTVQIKIPFSLQGIRDETRRD